MRRESFVFYRSFYEAIKELPRDIQGEIYTAVMEYGLNGNEIENLKPIARSILALVKPQIESNNRKFSGGQKGADFGHLGGRPRSEKKPQQNPSETPTKPLGNPNKTPNVNVNDNVNEKKEVTIVTSKKDFDLSFIEKDFEKTFLQFFEYRKELKKPFKTQIGVEEEYKNLKFLSKNCPETAKKIVEQSIRNEWQGLFELKTQNTQQQNGTAKNAHGASKRGTEPTQDAQYFTKI